MTKSQGKSTKLALDSASARVSLGPLEMAPVVDEAEEVGSVETPFFGVPYLLYKLYKTSPEEFASMTMISMGGGAELAWLSSTDWPAWEPMELRAALARAPLAGDPAAAPAEAVAVSPAPCAGRNLLWYCSMAVCKPSFKASSQTTVT